eukprot:2722284-Rhodomonas_salina.1
MKHPSTIQDKTIIHPPRARHINPAPPSPSSTLTLHPLPSNPHRPHLGTLLLRPPADFRALAHGLLIRKDAACLTRAPRNDSRGPRACRQR